MTSQVAFWLTNPDMSALFQKQNMALEFFDGAGCAAGHHRGYDHDLSDMDGFGYCLTGGSAQLIYGLPQAQRQALEQELFTTDSNYIGVSYLRLTMGASDMSARVFSYDDNASPSQPDTTLANFTLSDDNLYLVPLLKEILAINPYIKLLATPVVAAGLDEGQMIIHRAGPCFRNIIPCMRSILSNISRRCGPSGITISMRLRRRTSH